MANGKSKEEFSLKMIPGANTLQEAINRIVDRYGLSRKKNL